MVTMVTKGVLQTNLEKLAKKGLIGARRGSFSVFGATAVFWAKQPELP